MTVGQRIRFRRKELGLSVDDLAEKLGKNRATIYRYESNEIENLPTTILEPLAKVLQTTPGELMGWTDTKNAPIEVDRDTFISYIIDKLTEAEREKLYAFLTDLIAQRGK